MIHYLGRLTDDRGVSIIGTAETANNAKWLLLKHWADDFVDHCWDDYGPVDALNLRKAFLAQDVDFLWEFLRRTSELLWEVVPFNSNNDGPFDIEEDFPDPVEIHEIIAYVHADIAAIDCVVGRLGDVVSVTYAPYHGRVEIQMHQANEGTTFSVHTREGARTTYSGTTSARKAIAAYFQEKK